jgi:uncharacterized protein YjiS (DUF1127 family)
MTMSDLAFAPPRMECGMARFGERISYLIDTIELALQVRHERRMLLGLDDGMLKDLGLSRGDAYAEGTRSFWSVPINHARK